MQITNSVFASGLWLSLSHVCLLVRSGVLLDAETYFSNLVTSQGWGGALFILSPKGEIRPPVVPLQPLQSGWEVTNPPDLFRWWQDAFHPFQCQRVVCFDGMHTRAHTYTNKHARTCTPICQPAHASALSPRLSQCRRWTCLALQVGFHASHAVIEWFLFHGTNTPFETLPQPSSVRCHFSCRDAQLCNSVCCGPPQFGVSPPALASHCFQSCHRKHSDKISQHRTVHDLGLQLGFSRGGHKHSFLCFFVLFNLFNLHFCIFFLFFFYPN